MTTSPTAGPDARAHELIAARKLATSAAALVEQLQLEDLRQGREPVESATVREVERRRMEMQRAEERSRPAKEVAT